MYRITRIITILLCLKRVMVQLISLQILRSSKNIYSPFSWNHKISCLQLKEFRGLGTRKESSHLPIGSNEICKTYDVIERMLFELEEKKYLVLWVMWTWAHDLIFLGSSFPLSKRIPSLPLRAGIWWFSVPPPSIDFFYHKFLENSVPP